MTFKVVRDAKGDVVGYGPNDANFEPKVPPGGELKVEAQAPAPAPAKNAELTAEGLRTAGLEELRAAVVVLWERAGLPLKEAGNAK